MDTGKGGDGVNYRATNFCYRHLLRNRRSVRPPRRSGRDDAAVGPGATLDAVNDTSEGTMAEGEGPPSHGKNKVTPPAP